MIFIKNGWFWTKTCAKNICKLCIFTLLQIQLLLFKLSCLISNKRNTKVYLRKIRNSINIHASLINNVLINTLGFPIPTSSEIVKYIRENAWHALLMARAN